MSEPDPLANESQEYRDWIDAGAPEPTAAERINEGTCAYEGCDNDAEYRVEWEHEVVSLVCQPCSVRNHVYAKENGLLEFDVTAE